jgi:hypothetical protein
MWIFTNNAFISVVKDRDSNQLLVRARHPDHICNVIPKAIVFTLDDSDYKYRAFVDKREVIDMISVEIVEIDYDNFKASIKDRTFHDACLSVWSVMHRTYFRPN